MTKTPNQDAFELASGRIFTAIGECNEEIRKAFNAYDYEQISELTYFGLRLDALRKLCRIQAQAIEEMEEAYKAMTETETIWS